MTLDLDQLFGSMLGLVLGDAIGARFEGLALFVLHIFFCERIQRISVFSKSP